MGHDIDGETAANGARWIQVYDEPQLEEECDAAESDTMRRRMYEEEQEEEVCDAARERDAAEREAEELVAAWAELVEVCDAAESDIMRRRMYDEAALLQSAKDDDDADDELEEWTELDTAIELVAAFDALVERVENHLMEMEERRAWGDFEHSVAASQFFAAGVGRRSYLAGIVAWFRGR